MKSEDSFLLLLGAIVIVYLYSSQSVATTSGGGIPPDVPPELPPMPVPPVSTVPPIQQLTQDIQAQVYVDTQTGKVLTGLDATAIGAGATIAGTSTTGLFLGLSATSWTIIGAAVAGIIALVYALRSTTHLYANEIVQKYENPFGQYVIQIIQHMENMSGNGTLTCSDAQSMTQAVETAWRNYQDALHQLMSQGTDWEIVAKQSLNNLDNQFQGETLPNGKVLDLGMGGVYPNGFMTNWIQWMHTVTDSVCSQ